MRRLIFVVALIFLNFSCKNKEDLKPTIGNSLYMPWHINVNWGFEDGAPFLIDCKNNMENFKVKFESNVILDTPYKYEFSLIFNGIKIPLSEKDSTSNNNIYYLGDILNDIIKTNSIKQKILITAEVKQIVYKDFDIINIYTKKEHRYINIVNSGDKYSIVKDARISGFPSNYNPCQEAINSNFYKDYLVCDSSKKKLIIYNKKSIDFNLLGNDLNLYKLDLLEYFKFTFDTINILKGSYQTVRLQGGGYGSNKCQFPALFIVFDQKIESEYIADCDIFNLDSSVGSKNIYRPLNIGFIPCNTEITKHSK